MVIFFHLVEGIQCLHFRVRSCVASFPGCVPGTKLLVLVLLFNLENLINTNCLDTQYVAPMESSETHS